MNNRKAITRSQLESWGITKLFRMGDWWYMERKFTRKGKEYTILKQETTMRKKYVYVPTVTKRVFTLSVNGEHKSIQINRLLYAWFLGDVPEGMEVIGDPDNYRSLKLITVKENKSKLWTYLRNLLHTEDMPSN